MRLSHLLVLAILAAACASPTALAARTSLTLTAPEGAVQAEAVVPVEVALVISDFMCHEPRTLTIQLSAAASAGVKATWSRTNVTLDVPAKAYYAESYRASATVNLTVRALQPGEAELTAAFLEEDVGPCFVPGGFNPASTTLVLRVDGPAAAPPAASANESAESEADANETDTARVTPTTPRGTGPSCGPEGNCGAIGEYTPPAESRENDTPGVGYLLGMGVLALAALVGGKRRRQP